MALIFFLLRLWALDPVDANTVIAGDDHDLAAFLDQTAWRECRMGRCGIHDRDRWHARAVHRRAIDRGYLSPGVCPGHASRRGWSTRGAHGLMAGFAWRYLPRWARCFPPWILDVPIVSAWITVKRRDHLCSSRRAWRKRRWCRPGVSL